MKCQWGKSVDVLELGDTVDVGSTLEWLGKSHKSQHGFASFHSISAFDKEIFKDLQCGICKLGLNSEFLI